MIFTGDKTGAHPLVCVRFDDFDAWLANQTDACRQQVQILSFKPKIGDVLKWSEDDQIFAALVIDEDQYFESFGNLYQQLGAKVWYMTNPPENAQLAYLVYALGAYEYDRFKSQKISLSETSLYVKDDDLLKQVKVRYEAVYLVRDLINTPTNFLSPIQLAQQAKDLAERFGAIYTEFKDKELQKEFPAVWAVGKSAGNTARMVEIRWGQKQSGRHLTLVGKGVCFDTGGVNIKPAGSMRLMKKDMGGAANILGLASMIMALDLNISLRVIIPMVENAVSADSYRPGDVIYTRSGKTVEIGHTDAEGRVILADALTWACEEDTDLIIDMATLTGAARIALGAEIGALFSNDSKLAHKLMAHGKTQEDHLWQLPLFEPYRRHIKAPTGDINNSAEGSPGLAGAITAALFLSEFVEQDCPWAHLDIFGWSNGSKGRPKGGELFGGRAILAYLQEDFN